MAQSHVSMGDVKGIRRNEFTATVHLFKEHIYCVLCLKVLLVLDFAGADFETAVANLELHEQWL